MNTKSHHEFKVVIDGIDLPKDTVRRINEVLQRAVLAEVASIDLRGNELVFRPIMSKMVEEGNGGSTGGAQIKAIKLS